MCYISVIDKQATSYVIHGGFVTADGLGYGSLTQWAGDKMATIPQTISLKFVP